MNIKINTIWNALEALIAFSVAVIVTRLLILNFGMNQYGLFVTLSLLSSYGIISLFDLGMTGAAVTFAARYKNSGSSNELRMLWFFSLFYFLAVAFFSVIFVLVFISFDMGGILSKIQSTQQGLKILYPSLILTFLSFFSFAFTSFLQAFELYKPLQLVNILGHLTRLAAGIYISTLPAGIYYFLWIAVGIKFLTLIILFYILVSSVHALKSPLKPNFKLIKEWASYSIILFGSSINGFFMNMLDKFLIVAKLPFSEVARYDIANKPGGGLRMVLSVLFSALEPATIRTFATGGKPAVRSLYNKSTFSISAILMPLITVSFINMESILNVWLGRSDSVLVLLAIAAASYLIVVIHAGVANVMLVAVGAAGKILPSQILSAFIVFISMIYFINIYGLFGCILALFLGNLVGSILILRYFISFFKYRSTDQFRIIIYDTIFIFFISLLISWMFKKADFSQDLKLYELIFLFLFELTSIYIIIFFYDRMKKKESRCF